MNVNILGNIDTAIAAAYETAIDGMRIMGFAAHDVAELLRLREAVDEEPNDDASDEVFGASCRVERCINEMQSVFGTRAWTEDGRIYVQTAAGCWVFDYDIEGVWFVDFRNNRW